jgi:hypothetical protein
LFEVVYRTAWAYECNIIYYERYYSPIFMEQSFYYKVIHIFDLQRAILHEFFVFYHIEV